MINLSNSEIKARVREIGKKPLTRTSHAFSVYKKEIPIFKAATLFTKEYCKTAKSHPAIRLIEVVLAAHRNYNKHVFENFKRLMKDEVKTFDQLIEKKSRLSKTEFYSWWGPRDQQKYKVLSAVLAKVPALRNRYPSAKNDFHLMNSWAKDVDLNNLKKDIIGGIRNIGTAIVQHLRMVFGANTVKPDQRVKEVLMYEFDLGKVNDLAVIEQIEHISKVTGYSALLIDQVFVNFGSGYYTSKQDGLPRSVREKKVLKLKVNDIAKRLKKFGLDDQTIAKATRLRIKDVRALSIS
jgi:hypothetical protein